MEHGRQNLLVQVIERCADAYVFDGRVFVGILSLFSGSIWRNVFVHPPHLRFRIWPFRLLLGHMEVRGLVARVVERGEDECLFRV
jgi:hypothetical protein